jgi:hypothetical protein
MELRSLLPWGIGVVPAVFWPLFAVLVTYASLRVAYAIATRPLRSIGDDIGWTMRTG